MKFSFQALPAETIPRPVVPVSFPALPKVQLLGLVDSGALGTRISDEIADALEIDLSEAETRTFGVGGLDYHYRSTLVDVTIGRHQRPMRVDFVEDWKHEHALLGISGFFEEFVVRIDALRSELSLTPSRHPTRSRQV